MSEAPAPISAIVVHRSVEVIGVVVPAHDEGSRIGACLDSLEWASDHHDLGGVAIDVVVVLDGCTDDTAARVAQPRRLSVTSVAIDCRNVGLARGAGYADLLRRHAAVGSALWLASTDADSTVPADWFSRQLAWRRAGADAVAGTVVVGDWDDHPPIVQQRFHAHQLRVGLGHGHHHVHGANLAFSADAYRSVGGIAPVPVAEDHALWSALRAAGHRIVAAGDLAVTTSARAHGRAPLGFSSFLCSLDPRAT